MNKKLDSRIADLVGRWQHLAAHYGGDAAKGFRTESRRSATGLRKVAEVLGQQPMSHTLWQNDIDTLMAAVKVLERLGGEFEVAQRKCNQILKDETTRREAERQRQLAEARVAIFGPSPTEQEVMSLAGDVLAFAKACSEWARVNRRTDKGYWPVNDDWRLEAAVKLGKADVAVQIVCENYVDSWASMATLHGRVACDRDGTSEWYAGWSDFRDWQKQASR